MVTLSIPIIFNACGAKLKAPATLDFGTIQSSFDLTCSEYDQIYSENTIEERRDLIKQKYCPSATSENAKIGNGNVQLDMFRNEVLVQNPGQGQQKKAGVDVFVSGTQWSAFVTPSCLEPGELYSKIVAGKKLDSKYSFTALSFQLPEDISYSELNQSILEDSCVLGLVSESNYELSYFFSDTFAQSGSLPHIDHIQLSAGLDLFYDSSYSIDRSSNEYALVGVVDSGVAAEHPDLTENIFRFNTPLEIIGSGLDMALKVEDEDYASNEDFYIGDDITGHGSHVAGIIAAENNSIGVVGVSSRSTRILNLKAFRVNPTTGNVSSTSSFIVESIKTAICNDVEVLNMSFQGDSGSNPQADPVYREAISDAIQAGVLLVTVAGNSSSSNPQQELTDEGFNVVPGRYGAELQGMITVAALDANGSDLASYSFYSPVYAEIAAPGTSIYSTVPQIGTGIYTYEQKFGTSMAAPMVSGAAALVINLLRTYDYYPTPELVEDILLTSAQVNAKLIGKVKNGGQLNIYRVAREIHRRFPKTQGGSCSD